MLISCPECETSFTIPANALGEKGRKVKCSKCSNTWHQNPITVQKEKLDRLLQTKKAEKSSNEETALKQVANEKYKNEQTQSDPNIKLPVKVTRKLFYSLSASFVILLLASVLLIFLNYSSATESYSGLRFTNFSVSKEIIDNKYDFSVSGEFMNVTGEEIKIPKVKIKIFSQGGRVMSEGVIVPEVNIVPPYSKIAFNPEITQVSGNADSVEISFTNWAEDILN